MATLDEIGQEKQRISERLARIDAERTKLADQLSELEITERVLTRFGGSADTSERRRRGRPARTAAAAAPQRRARGGQQAAASVSLSDATLQAVKAHPDGATATDILSARGLGRVVKLLAICDRCDGGVSVRVHPAMIPRSHPLASVSEAYNAVFVEAESAGRLMFYGAGAGGTPTASAVLGDIVAVARNRLAGTRGPDASTYAGLPVMPMGETLTRYHVSLDVDDKPGVLAPVAEAYARHDVSIEAVRQASRGAEAQLVIVTHTARDAALAATVRELEALPAVRAVASVMRVEGEEE